MDKAAVLTHILRSKVRSTCLGGDSPVSVISSKKYIPALTAEAQDHESMSSVDHAIRGALSDGTRLVVLVGPEGSGKTTALQKLLVDWAKGEHLHNFSFVFHFQFKEMDSLEGQLSLETLIQYSRHQVHSVLRVVERPDDALFVFDGLDEYSHSLDPAGRALCSDASQAASAPLLLVSLLHGSLLKGAAFLVATRPTGNLKFLSGARVEALGFLKPQREAFFNSFFADSSVASRALLHMERTLGFYDFCTSPRFCWTVCFVYRSLIDSNAKLPETLSQLFVEILSHLIQSTSLTQDWNRKLVLALGRMASYCFLDKHSRCTKEQINSFGFQQFLTAFAPFLRVEAELETVSFRSQLMQEFVLALAFFLDGSEYEDVEKVLDKHKGAAKFLDLFLSGLSEPEQHRPLETLVGELDPDQMKGFRSWLKSGSEETLKGYDKNKHYRCFRLLHQVQNASLVKEIVPPLAHACIYHRNPGLQDCVALSYVIVCLGERDRLSVSGATVIKEMMEVLAPALSLSHVVELSDNSFQTEAVPRLASAVSSGVTRELNLTRSHLGDEKLKRLCAGLKDSKLHRLNLGSCRLTAACCDDLLSLLTSEISQLQALEITFNQIGDRGFKKLCKAMHSPLCRLQELQMQTCDLTAASMEDFAAALCSGHSQLRKINLTHNTVGDSGVKALCNALKHPFCKLQSLTLYDCGLTGACCSHLKEALMSEHFSLLELDLSLNDLGQEGALMLCQGLSRPGCPIRSLSLTRCELTQTVFKELGSLLRSGSCQMMFLLVGLNKVGDEGVRPLWDAVSHPSCSLEELNVEMTRLTDACVEDLCAAVRGSRTLKRLELRNNSLTDAAVPAVIQAMRDNPNMEELK
ncbi:NACHT, LRR and PYD domains-containing protein 12 isoform X2 [Austrofundulus limnaeus]|uniref:NACHT, LRR and PYD domains-containing protein 12 isoform X2 n=1 Tax=Austrofundulus limnaeus TaxID=52670 RepID=A0A2I4BW21_AUSLI|nr:PREDICTED: NACHT, LRR and PYD domains-containing protein 12-like isoform X2 [Austrofundulus limnaeus]